MRSAIACHQSSSDLLRIANQLADHIHDLDRDLDLTLAELAAEREAHDEALGIIEGLREQHESRPRDYSSEYVGNTEYSGLQSLAGLANDLTCSECGHASTASDPVIIQAVPAGLIGEAYVPRCADGHACAVRQAEWRKANGLRTEKEIVASWFKGKKEEIVETK